MKSELEKLPNGALLRILRQLKKVLENEPFTGPVRLRSEEILSPILKNYGISNHFEDLDFLWAAYKLNEDKLEKETGVFELEKPKLKNWNIICKISGRAWYTERTAQIVNGYNEPSKMDLNDGDRIDINPFDGEYYDYETHDSESNDWEIEEIEYVGINKEQNIPSVNEQKTIKQPNIDDLNVFELVKLKEQIEKKIKERLIIID